MQDWMLKMIIPWIMGFITELLTKENFKKYADKLLDLIEDAVADSETSWDDTLVLPVINQFRAMLDIPDNDLPEPSPEEAEE